MIRHMKYIQRVYEYHENYLNHFMISTSGKIDGVDLTTNDKWANVDANKD